jgi:hypothetical protein
MGSIASISIDLSKLDKSKIVNGKNGQKYYNLNIGINDLSDQYGNNIQVTEPQTLEQRNAKEPKTFYGNGKIFWTDGKIEVAKKNEVSSKVANNNDSPF